MREITEGDIDETEFQDDNNICNTDGNEMPCDEIAIINNIHVEVSKNSKTIHEMIMDCHGDQIGHKSQM